jgi:hypothetical protein
VRVFFIAVSIAAIGFWIHWIWWRIRIPKRQTAALLATFSLVLAAGLIATTGATAIAPPAWRLTSGWEVLHVTGFNVAAMLAYVVAYSAIEERSPSMTILSRVAATGADGASHDELEALLKRASPVNVRLNAMLRDGMVRADGGRFALTAKGLAWARVFSSWRRILAFTKGG